MKKTESILEKLPCSYPIEHLCSDGKLLFIDIETTGFTAKSSSLYMIGCASKKGDNWVITQFLAQTPEEERQILSDFIEFSKAYDVLVHFNGNNFDLPYLKAKSEQYNLGLDLDRFQGVDLYRRVAPYKDFLHLENCKQKTIERFLGIQREDPYNGGELINVYTDYVHSQDEEREKALLLHNYEDMIGMLEILPILSYFDMFSRPIRVVAAQAKSYEDVNGLPAKELILRGTLDSPILKPVSGASKGIIFSAKENEVVIKVPIFCGELKYFYSNYKDYYYLPEEDTALHKSVASFVDSSHREQATASTCYTRKESEYLPEWENLFEPIFLQEYKDHVRFFELTDEMKKNRDLFSSYASHLLTVVGLQEK